MEAVNPALGIEGRVADRSHGKLWIWGDGIRQPRLAVRQSPSELQERDIMASGEIPGDPGA